MVATAGACFNSEPTSPIAALHAAYRTGSHWLLITTLDRHTVAFADLAEHLIRRGATVSEVISMLTGVAIKRTRTISGAYVVAIDKKLLAADALRAQLEPIGDAAAAARISTEADVILIGDRNVLLELLRAIDTGKIATRAEGCN